jgi:hypothetical protein
MPHPPKPPSIDHGVVSAIWAVALSAFIWAGLKAVGVSEATAVILASVAFCVIFVFVRVYGEEEPRRQRKLRAPGR